MPQVWDAVDDLQLAFDHQADGTADLDERDSVGSRRRIPSEHDAKSGRHKDARREATHQKALEELSARVDRLERNDARRGTLDPASDTVLRRIRELEDAVQVLSTQIEEVREQCGLGLDGLASLIRK